MRITFTLLALVVLCATRLHAGPQEQIKQRAKDARDQNNTRQGVPTAPPASGQTARQQSEAPRPNSARPNPVAKLKADLTAWQTQKQVSAATKKEFAHNLLAAVRGKSPSSSTLEKFTDSLAAAVAGKSLGASELSRLVRNINLAINSTGLSEERINEVAAEVQADLESLGTTQAAAAAKDLKAIMTELSN